MTTIHIKTLTGWSSAMVPSATRLAVLALMRSLEQASGPSPLVDALLDYAEASATPQEY